VRRTLTTPLAILALATPKDKGFSVYNDMAQKLEKREYSAIPPPL
jgi:hypothetical protein